MGCKLAELRGFSCPYADDDSFPCGTDFCIEPDINGDIHAVNRKVITEDDATQQEYLFHLQHFDSRPASTRRNG